MHSDLQLPIENDQAQSSRRKAIRVLARHDQAPLMTSQIDALWGYIEYVLEASITKLHGYRGTCDRALSYQGQPDGFRHILPAWSCLQGHEV